MTSLDDLYNHLLRVGLIVLREAIASGDTEWAGAEVEMLHNIPGLIGEGRLGPHLHYFENKRVEYLQWIMIHGSEHAISRMRTFYEPIWEELATVLRNAAPVEDAD